MTEQEPKAATCHLTLIPVASADGSAPWFSPQACIGAACSAWRWGFDMSTEGNTKGAIRHSTKAGYCGLAGKP